MNIFIGSSKEAQQELREVSAWIQKAGLNPLPWDTPSLFRPGENTYQKLIEIAKDVDGAVFIFSEDDKVWYRNDKLVQPRDNLLIEYGLFSGILGPTRTVICLKGSPRLATNLLGIIHINISSNMKARAQLELQDWAHKLSQDIIKEPKSPRLWKNRHELLPSISRRIELAKKSIFFVGFSLKSTLDHHTNVLVDTLNDNSKLKVKMLMVHPDSLHVTAHEPFADRNVSKEVRDVLGQLESLYNDLKGSAKKRIDVRLTDYLPRFAVKAFDNETMLINLYLYKSRAQENPVFEINKTSNNQEFNNIHKHLIKLFDLKDGGKIKRPNQKLIEDGKWKGLSKYGRARRRQRSA